MKDFVHTQTLSRLESMMRRFMVVQTVQNKEFMDHFLHVNETLRHLNTVVDSLVTSNKELETKISSLVQTSDCARPDSTKTVEEPMKISYKKSEENTSNPFWPSLSKPMPKS